jgi:hypothetical protein
LCLGFWAGDEFLNTAKVNVHYARLARELARRFQEFPAVEAVAWGGSQAAAGGDGLSDIDLYICTTATIPLAAREALVAETGSSRADLNLQLWDLGDEWYDADTGLEVDVIYWESAWIESQLDRVWRQHQASLGYTTCFWYTIYHSQALYDRRGWFANLQRQSERPYPETLRQAIIAKNHAALRRVIPSYVHQIEKACHRNDPVSLNHRVAALLASYFDVIFALNRVLHPGEKRLIEWAQAHCEQLPMEMAEQITALLQAACSLNGNVLQRVNALLDNLDDLLRQEGVDPATSLPLRSLPGA